jgi:hypothetical protein
MYVFFSHYGYLLGALGTLEALGFHPFAKQGGKSAAY